MHKMKYRYVYGEEISKLNDNCKRRLIKYNVVAAKVRVKSCFSFNTIQ